METTTEQKNWLERMHSFLTWKVITPSCQPHFGTAMSDKVLNELASQKEILKKYVELRGLMDGEELFRIKNLAALSIETKHPELSKMPKAEIKKYFEGYGIYTLIDKELDIIQAEYLAEIERRKQS